MTRASTRTVVLLGHPVAHSRSPEIHTAAFAAAAVDAVYVTADVAPDSLPAAVAGLRALGVLGANVTVPHKQATARLVDDLTDTAALAGAVNTLFWSRDRLVGDNTDVLGLEAVMREAGVSGGDDVLIAGAGGVARAAAVASGRLGAGVRVVARRRGPAGDVTALARRAGARAPTGAGERVVVNATPLGMHGERLPVEWQVTRHDQVAVDCVYADETTPFVTAARAAGATAVEGLTLLVAQAAGSFERWTGTAAPLGAMRAAVAS